MSDDRRKILEMLASGKISATEAEGLIDALSGKEGTATATATLDSPGTTVRRDIKYLRVMIDSKLGDNVNVRVPVALLRAGLKLSALMPPQAYRQINEKIAERGINLDLSALKTGDIEQLIESMSELNVDVFSAQGDKVKVFFE
jgi:hypothetical protein